MTQRGRSAVSVAQLIEAGLLRAGQQLRLRGPEGATARVTASGTVEIEGVAHRSPSAAARAAKGGTSTNGWIAWQVEDGGRWTTLAEIRERLKAATT